MTTRRTRTVNPSTAITTSNNPPTSTTTTPIASSDVAPINNVPDPNALPVAYPPLLFSHSLFLLALVVILPRSSFLIPVIAESLPKRDRGLDRPQAAWLEPLTASPTLTLFWCILGSGLLVSWWAGWMRQWVREGRMGGGGGGVEERLNKLEKEKEGGEVNKGSGKARELVNAWIFTLYVSVFYHVILVLFGAPITTHIPQTYFLSLLLSILTSLTPAYALGPPSLSSSTFERLSQTTVFPLSLPIRAACFLFALVDDDTLKGKEGSSANARVVRNDMWVRLFAELSPQTAPSAALLFPSLSSLSSAWLCTIPLALDWDRPWQAYPLTTAYGAVVGYVLGGLGALGWSGIRSVWKEVREGEMAQKMEDTGNVKGVKGGKVEKKKGKKN
ncbi:uncharacterized protein STEHIDRAFT_167945 [Stereum hirsutum FP-91666 SS1]|uniref:uncharacterized protein n=1 Tax=Stereum hirsutum (strain FP-91666) TaxID=721885 RepID=UPI000440A0CA|nr:uncharacterized protein STEHIDRAFT_167945 [Stereum hirsutum FP-91666 SS1]EIM87085.1 hypothetical protein STEHIDRAFT_167945 [Stereum hirsutum FP-91666 SS1]